jgi:diaminopimelate epimerase
MALKFHKYQGTGNDFIMISAQENVSFQPSAAMISKLCDRRFGIGADGLIIIKPYPNFDFEIDYYNADGTQSFCGNGARCSVKFAAHLGLMQNTCKFWAIDGAHEAEILANGQVKLRMADVQNIQKITDSAQDYELHTGSPHYVRFTDNEALDIVDFGKAIRFNDTYKNHGINVNTARFTNEVFRVQTYERGVEGETFSCGTGVTAVALAGAVHFKKPPGSVTIQTKGGTLQVHWQQNGNTFHDIFLEGPAEFVYEGSVVV